MEFQQPAKKSRDNSRRAVKSELGFIPGTEMHRRLRSNDNFTPNVEAKLSSPGSGGQILELSHD